MEHSHSESIGQDPGDDIEIEDVEEVLPASIIKPQDDNNNHNNNYKPPPKRD